MKCIAKLMQYDFVIEYKKGRENKATDLLSRLPSVELAEMVMAHTALPCFRRLRTVGVRMWKWLSLLLRRSKINGRITRGILLSISSLGDTKG